MRKEMNGCNIASLCFECCMFEVDCSILTGVHCPSTIVLMAYKGRGKGGYQGVKWAPTTPRYM